jgi:hypothetical protein
VGLNALFVDYFIPIIFDFGVDEVESLPKSVFVNYVVVNAFIAPVNIVRWCTFDFWFESVINFGNDVEGLWGNLDNSNHGDSFQEGGCHYKVCKSCELFHRNFPPRKN